MQLAAARAAQEGNQETSPMATKAGPDQSKERQKVFIVMGIITAFICMAIVMGPNMICVGTWNIGGRTLSDDLDIKDWLDIEEPADVYVLG